MIGSYGSGRDFLAAGAGPSTVCRLVIDIGNGRHPGYRVRYVARIIQDRVLTLDGPGHHSRKVIEVAHHW